MGCHCAWIRTNGCQCQDYVCNTLYVLILNPRSFHACRYPTKPSDTAKKFDPQAHNHVVFVRKNKFYEVPLITPEGHELSEAELEVWVLHVLSLNLTLRYAECRQVERIIKMAGEDKGAPVGALTAENRDIWTDVSYLAVPFSLRFPWSNLSQARSALIASSSVNQKSLERIESSAIIVCLDDTKPVLREDISWSCWVGDGRNRFYDKHQCTWRLNISLFTSIC